MTTNMRCLIWLATLAALPSVLAQPAYMNYQGRLTDDQGRPLANGLYTVEFAIYDTVSGTNLVWGPFLCDGGTASGHTAMANLVEGRFNVILGPNDTAGGSLTNAFLAAERFVEISVNNGPPIQPRQQFLSAPYALQSQRAQVADIATSLVQELADALCPPGTIVAFGGPTNNLPRGWLLCDGSAVNSNAYPRLYAAIGRAWGDGTQAKDGMPITPPSTYHFNLPDLRGLFLRGQTLERQGTNAAPQILANNAWGDPDWASRTASRAGGNAGNLVGSVQTNQILAHTHSYLNDYATTGDDGSSAWYERYDSHYEETLPTGGKETRPKNAYVNYMIKY
jgi:microcystin-dependent protein